MDKEMDALFTQAERDGLWFFSPYQQLWFSPAELKREQANGRFRWGAVNWRLRDPKEALEGMEAEAQDVQRRTEQFKARLGGKS